MISPTAVVIDRHNEWPLEPYKGLTFYSEGDAPLFAGRDNDVDAVCESIGLGNIRILLLHGLTGCGKSSFLRAGLIPALEEEIAGYEFLRDERGRPDFVRSTDDPIASLGRRVYRFIQREHSASQESEDLRNLESRRAAIQTRGKTEARSNQTTSTIPLAETGLDEAEFLRAIDSDPRRLLRAVEQIASQRSRTFVLVIDQAEEVITLKPDSPGNAARNQFFDFLSDLSRSRFDLKLIVCFRTEYHGQFYSQLRYGADVSRISDYFLNEFSEEQIVEAIVRPTSTDHIRGYGVPQAYYHFDFEKGLPTTIAKRLLASGLSGGILPALQIVCRRLYEGIRPQSSAIASENEQTDTQRTLSRTSGLQQQIGPLTITSTAFTTLGGIAGQVISYLESELGAALREPFAAKVGLSVRTNEIDAWRRVLTTLVKTQINGTVTTDIIPEEVLRRQAKDQGCQIDAQDMFGFLTDERRRILRFVDITKLSTKEIIHCFSLGHDVLADALSEWRERIRRKPDSEGVTFRSKKFNSNVNGKSYAMNAIAPIKPWKVPILRTILFMLGSIKPLQIDMKRMSVISFLRWVIVRRTQWPRFSKQQAPERLKYDYLLLICSLDITWHEYLESLSAVLSNGIDLIYRWTEKFPGSRPITPFKQYFTSIQFATDYYYSAYPYATTSDVRAAHRVVSAFQAFETLSESLSDEKFETAYLQFVLRVQGDLGRTEPAQSVEKLRHE